MKLGTYSHLTIGTANADESIAFYHQLGFELIGAGESPNPFFLISDDGLLILLNQEGENYLALNYYSGEMEEKLAEIEQAGIPVIHKMEHEGMLNMAVIGSPEGLMIGLVNLEPEGHYIPGSPRLIDLAQEDWQNPEKYPNKHLGIFGEISLPTTDLQTSLNFWETLGFKTTGVYNDPYPWAIVYDGINVIGLHQAASMKSPAITYFSPNQPENVKALIELGLDLKVAMGKSPESGNAVLTTPEGQRFFLFKM
ncbi:MAG: VOC family protein [Bacteroidia bacterium]|nr:VOC family protein [Bacteroidia bacterium]